MSIVCRICGTEIPIDQNLCPNCGRLKVNFPAILPDKLKKLFDEEKVRYDQDVKDGDEKVSFSAATEESLKKEISEQIQKLEALEKEKKDAEAKAESRANELSNQLLEATKRADAAEERIAENTKVIQGIQMEKNELLEQIKAHDVERPIAFLVVMQDEEMVTGTINRRVTDVFPVLHGKNVFGKNPKEDSDVHSQKIIYCKEMQAEHFLLEGKTDNSFIIQNISGTTFLRNKSNNLNSTATDLYDGDEIFIGDLVFVFISK